MNDRTNLDVAADGPRYILIEIPQGQGDETSAREVARLVTKATLVTVRSADVTDEMVGGWLGLQRMKERLS